MPQANRRNPSPRLYTMPELIEMRRQVLRFARSLPPGQSGIIVGRLPHRCEACLETRTG